MPSTSAVENIALTINAKKTTEKLATCIHEAYRSLGGGEPQPPCAIRLIGCAFCCSPREFSSMSVGHRTRFFRGHQMTLYRKVIRRPGAAGARCGLTMPALQLTRARRELSWSPTSFCPVRQVFQRNQAIFRYRTTSCAYRTPLPLGKC